MGSGVFIYLFLVGKSYICANTDTHSLLQTQLRSFCQLCSVLGWCIKACPHVFHASWFYDSSHGEGILVRGESPFGGGRFVHE